MALTAAAMVVIIGCGSSSKPGYCEDSANLQSAIKNLPRTLASDGVSGLQTELTAVKSDASALASSAKSDFPTETAAVTDSVDTLSSAVEAAPSNPSAQQIAAVASDAAAVVTSAKDFASATKSKCD